MKRIAISARRRNKAAAALRRRESRQAHEDAVRQTRGLIFAGIGTCAATIALGIQIWQTFETREVNWRTVQGLAFERMEALRDTGAMFTSDWSYETVRDSGHELIDLSWQGLKFRGVNIAKCTEDEFARSFPAALDHSNTTMIQSTINCVVFRPGTSLKGAELVNVEFNEGDVSQADLSEANLLGVTFQSTGLRGVRFDKASSVINTTFERADLRGAVFTGQGLYSAESFYELGDTEIPIEGRTAFIDSDLTGADFRHTSIMEAGNISQFADACVDNTSMIEFTNGAGDLIDYVPTRKNRCICGKVDAFDREGDIFDLLDDVHACN